MLQQFRTASLVGAALGSLSLGACAASAQSPTASGEARSAVTATVPAATADAAVRAAPVPTAVPPGPKGAPAPVSDSVSSNDYRMGPGDKVRVIVFGEPSLTGEFDISPAGTISFPLIGEVKAENITITQFREALRAKLADGYLNDPKVSAEVENFRPFYILGEVKTPGEYPFTNGLTVLNAVAKAGGFTYRANSRRVLIRHSGEPKQATMPLDAVTPVAPGDTIVIKERYF